MRKFGVLLGALALAAALPAAAADRERTLTGAAIGAGAGAVVAGPVGAVAGGVIGATVGGPRVSRPGYRVARHKVYWRDRYGRSHWRWSY
jgi:osmotically inducible lipoprotein OsmB